ncbi:DUF4982 domain-containing protein [Streptomyces canus]|uniref:DUF4982 domain-containing protein n=1 Tax=Streptomyces canus TaxID=58343 RepID=UPI00386F37DF
MSPSPPPPTARPSSSGTVSPSTTSSGRSSASTDPTKANWASSPTLYITSRRWTQRTDATTELKVYSNASQVTATLNGTLLGTLSSSDHICRWTNVTLKQGENTVTVTATINGSTYTDSVEWILG